VLARHAAAVTTRDRGRFAADVDAATPASDFRSRQLAQFANLANVPLHSWTYAVVDTVSDASVLANARSRLRAPVAVVHLTLSYALAGIDDAPSTHELWWTFVRRHGTVYLAGDSDVTGSGGVSWKGPWDYGPLVVRRGTASLVLAHPNQAGALAALAADADAAVAVVAGVVPSGWARAVAVLVPGSSAELAAQSQDGQSTELADVQAEVVFDSVGTTTGPTGARVVVNPAVLGTLTPTGRRIVLQHEITHVATASVTGLGMPRWVVEGFAEYVGNLGSGQPVAVAASELAAQVRAGRLPTALPDDGAVSPSASGAAAAYEQSWLACRLIASRAGQAALLAFYRAVGTSDRVPSDAVNLAVQTVLHESTAAFVAQWRAYLSAELG
jgi:hypothetical protein